MQRLTGLDATFLYLETPTLHMHVCMAAVFDPSTVPGGYSFEKTMSVIESRLPQLTPFRRRLVEVPFQLHHPVWVEDPDFDLSYHVRRVAVPSPGGPKEFAALAADITSRHLDRSRPLWEMWIVEGLEHGHVGAVAKMHHCTIDGVSGAELMVHLFDLEPEPPPREHQGLPPKEHVPTDVELVGYAVASMMRQPAQLALALPRTVQAVTNVIRRRREQPDDQAVKGMPAPLTAPRTPFNAAVTAHRGVSFASLSLDDAKAVKKQAGTTVNDVVLAICAGGLRGYLERKGELPEKPLLAVVPISVRAELEGEGSNKVSAMFTSLATDIDDPLERLHAIAEVTRAAKDEHKAIGANLLQDWAEFAPPRMFASAARVYSRMNLADRHRPIHNVVISNVPGPDFPLYFAGAQLVASYPLGPVMEGAGLNITVMSYMGSLDFGLHACRELIPDLWDLATDFGDALEELKKATAAT